MYLPLRAYRFFTSIVSMILPVAALFVPKIKLWREERADNLNRLRQFVDKNTKPIFWLHCASHGEYEQSIPLLKYIAQKQKDYAITVTFFSPSGYQNMKTYDIIDWKGYIPLDSKRKATQFLDILQPAIAVFVKNEFWWNTVAILHQRNIPYHWIYVTTREHHYFIKWRLSIFAKLLNGARNISTVDKESRSLLLSTYPDSHVEICLDGKYVQALLTMQEEVTLPIMEACKQMHKPIIVYGSAWMEDLKVLQDVLRNKEYIHIIFPHDLSPKNLDHMSTMLSNVTIVSSPQNISPDTILIINKMGLLKHAYRYADIAYIGGGFGEGVHNVLEAAIYDIPTLCGTSFKKSVEARYLIEKGVLRSVKNKKECSGFLTSPRYNKLSNIVTIDTSSIDKQYTLLFSKTTQS